MRSGSRAGHSIRHVWAVIALAGTFVGAASTARSASEESPAVEELARLSLEELGDLPVTSVSKLSEPLRKAAAAIYVITHDEISRSGVTSLAAAIRLAPNLRITQMGASNYTATARGFGGNQADQAFPNKLLVLIDGRSVYTPLFSGLYLDVQDVLLEDIDRIEVISGPGATLWGANAVNGVINVITRPAYLTSGTLVTAGAGSKEQNLSARYGGKISDATTYRMYAKGFNAGSEELSDRSSAHDGWSKAQAGFRFDWTHEHDTVTAQGDIYRGTENQLGQADILILGGNALARWLHRADRSELQVQAYADQTERSAPGGGVAFVLHTYDIELQQSVELGSAQRLVWGAGERLNSYGITNSQTLLFLPDSRALTLANLFAQDTISIGGAVKLIFGIKGEDDPYSGWSLLPDARLSWQLSDHALLWAAAARAIRSPTPFDEDVVEKVGGRTFLTGNARFRPERVSAYELGYRGQPASNLSLSISSFYNVYDDLRTVEPASSTTFLPLRWDNQMQGHTIGVEAWADWQLTPWWRLSPGVRTLHKELRFKPGASSLLGLAQSGDDPTAQASLKSSMDLAHGVTFDALLRYVGALPDPSLRAYTELNARLGWRVSKKVELSVSVFNLLHARHVEYPAPAGEGITRSAIVQARWLF